MAIVDRVRDRLPLLRRIDLKLGRVPVFFSDPMPSKPMSTKGGKYLLVLSPKYSTPENL
jgi:hypothetical protein